MAVCDCNQKAYGDGWHRKDCPVALQAQDDTALRTLATKLANQNRTVLLIGGSVYELNPLGQLVMDGSVVDAVQAKARNMAMCVLIRAALQTAETSQL